MTKKRNQIIRTAILNKLKDDKVAIANFAVIMNQKHKLSRSTTYDFLKHDKKVYTETADKMLKELNLNIVSK